MRSHTGIHLVIPPYDFQKLDMNHTVWIKVDRVNLRVAWLYVKSWNNFGQHVIDETGLWNFGGDDLEAALMALTYKRKTDKTERTKDLKEMIMERFDNNMAAFVEWSQSLHSEVYQRLKILTLEWLFFIKKWFSWLKIFHRLWTTSNMRQKFQL